MEPISSLPFYALRERLAQGYSACDLRADGVAATVVALVAIPLAMALAIAIGATPDRGLVTMIVAGSLTGLLGGSRFQITGPTAAFVVVLAPIVRSHGMGGLLMAGMLAGAILLMAGALRLGRLIERVPPMVNLGFTTGIALVIAVLQLKDALGLTLTGVPNSFVDRLAQIGAALPSARLNEVVVGAVTFALLTGIPRFFRRVPAPLVAIVAASALNLVLPVETIGSRFGALPRGLPTPLWPDFARAFTLLPSAVAIAMLAAMESLLTALTADRAMGTRHEPNAELLALGVANMVCPILGGIPGTGAMSRTMTNARFGARSPLAAVMHALLTLGVVAVAAPLLERIPMASLAALLLYVAVTMAEAGRFWRSLLAGSRTERWTLAATFLGTVFADMVVGVGLGLFIHKLAPLYPPKV